MHQTSLIDIYCFAVNILFVLSGKHEWNSTVELQSLFENRMQKAEMILDQSTFKVLKPILSKCLLISKTDVAFDSATEILMSLNPHKDKLEEEMVNNSIPIRKYANDISS